MMASLLAGILMIAQPSDAILPEPAVVTAQLSEEAPELQLEMQEDRLIEEVSRHEEERLEAKRSIMEASRGGRRSLLDYPLHLRSGLTPAELDQVLSDTPFAGLGSAFYEAEQTYGVNALALISIAALESGWGRSEYALVRNNLFGYGAYTHDPDQAVHFDSWYDSIQAAARTLAEDYLHPEGRYYQGGTLAAIGPIWAADPEWAVKICDIIGELLSRVEEVN